VNALPHSSQGFVTPECGSMDTPSVSLASKSVAWITSVITPLASWEREQVFHSLPSLLCEQQWTAAYVARRLEAHQ
jgi:hypothetical protein